MICPKCGAEYHPGYTSCADCRVLLVPEPPMGDRSQAKRWAGRTGALEQQDPLARSDDVYRGDDQSELPDPSEDPFCSFWKGADARVCAELCTVLEEAGIPHKTIHRQDHLFNIANQSPYELGVPASLYEKAEFAVKEAFGTDEETGEGAVPLLPAPDRDPADFEKGLRDAIADANEWLGPRYPEDATVEIWSGPEMDAGEMIEMSLKENDLMTRVESDSGRVKLFVLPQDEAQAREIVREIVEGVPPE